MTALGAARVEEGMTMTQGDAAGPSSGSGSSTGQAVREQAGQVAQTAREQTREVVRETGTQARNLVSEAQGELSHQASMQQKRAAEGLRALGSELRSMDPSTVPPSTPVPASSTVPASPPVAGLPGEVRP